MRVCERAGVCVRVAHYINPVVQYPLGEMPCPRMFNTVGKYEYRLRQFSKPGRRCIIVRGRN